MAEIKEKYSIYYIPQNYIGEGKILQGSISLRRLIEGIILAIPFALIGLGLGKTLQSKITLTILFAGPIIAFSIIGYNGDPLSVTLKSLFNWRKTRGVKLYNPNPRPFAQSPTDTIFAEDVAKDKIVGKVEDYQKKRLEAHLSKEYKEGETFMFADDAAEARYHGKAGKIPEIPDTAELDDDLSALDDLYTDTAWYKRRQAAVDIAGEDGGDQS